MKELFFKYKTIIKYLIFGVLTTLINIITYGISTRVFSFSTLWGTALAWVISVFFAYVTNRRFVFESKAYTWYAKIKELTSFFSCRIATGVLDLILMYICVDLLKIQDIFVKCAANIIIIILNYIASKAVVFRK